MYNGIVKKISILAVSALLGACASLPSQSSAQADNPPILSAADARAQIQVTIKPLPPVVQQPELVAAID